MHDARRGRTLRGLLAASVALFGHLLGGGALPGFAGVAVPFALSLLVCVLLAGRRLSLVRLSLSVAISQTLFHSLFVLGTPGPLTRATSEAAGAAHAGHGGAITLAEPSVHLAHAQPDMWAAHALAAVLTIAALYQGERVLHAIVAVRDRVWAAVLPRVTAELSPRPAPPLVAGVFTLAVPQRRAADPVTPVRGPPRLVTP
ncbi:hypothetical protein [Agromyces soli]|uniref:Integral membrane protein n=1 Tax=Agromyces soli TaxID=659012 RepID=A0ABY4AZC9_9MICO|nr:hypothetical protein [Agromyces soli]UOE27183.1 hypothetical protein MTP13_05200 [Agromyces soli]